MEEKSITKSYSFELVEDFDANDEAFASLAQNKQFNYIKFVLTDDKPNANKQRVPKEEFPNLIKSGIFAPIKMAMKEIKSGHEEALPMGPITHLKEYNNQILGIAALWSKERPDEVGLLKTAYANKTPLNISWEILFKDSKVSDDGVEDLLNTSLKGATIVGMPAYEGRTPILSVASKESGDENMETESAKWTRAYMNNLPDSAFLYVEPGGKKDSEGKTVPRTKRHLVYKDDSGKIDAPHLRNALSRLGQPATGNKGDWLTESLRKSLEAKARRLLASANASMEDTELTEIEELTQEIVDLNETIANQKKEIDGLKETSQSELESLREFKASVEKKEADAAKLQAIKDKFTEAGIKKEDEYFEKNRDRFLAMNDEDVEFMIQELSAFASSEVNTRDTSASTIPNFLNTNAGTKVDPVAIGRLMREQLMTGDK